MDKRRKELVVTGVILFFIMLSLFSIQLMVSSNADRQLRGKINRQSIVIESLEAKVGALQNKDSLLQQRVDQLDTSILESEKDIAGLSGDLAKVKSESEENVEQLQASLANLKVEFQDFSSVIEESVGSVVSVQTDSGSGSGFITDDNGHIVTNYHVIEGARAASIITHDGSRHGVRVAGFHRRADVAVLQINDTNYKRLRFGDSDAAKVGEKVIAIGNPGGLDFTVTQGIVSAVDREDALGNKYIQIDVPINPGNSGGPLIDSSGRVIGMNTLKIEGFEGVGFALSSNYIDDIVEDIIEN